MSRDERETLLAAQRKAAHVLSVARAEAKRVSSAAEVEAVALVLDQQRLAESLLLRQQADATGRADSSGVPGDLLESHRTAAELLVATQDEAASKLSNKTANGAVDVLMAGQREAAAILLDAWMQVTEGRPPAGNRSD
jgi:hypothetical protein